MWGFTVYALQFEWLKTKAIIYLFTGHLLENDLLEDLEEDKNM
jgi:hypothetical protein